MLVCPAAKEGQEEPAILAISFLFAAMTGSRKSVKKFFLSLIVIFGFISYAIRQRSGLTDASKNTTVPQTTQQTQPADQNPVKTNNSVRRRLFGGDEEGENGRFAAPSTGTGSTNSTPSTTTPSRSTSANTRTPSGMVRGGMMGKYKDGTYTGAAADAYYGNIQVRAMIQNSRLADVKFLQHPSDRQTSIAINSRAMPYLRSEAISAQNANVDIVTGATDSSLAFRQSLASALSQAH